MSARDFFPTKINLTSLREAATDCQGCDLYEHATQTVFGEGPREAQIILIGEQPGDREDIEGRPFVGPAGKLLEEALSEAGIERDEVYITNAVKHFSFTESGKRRLHKKPSVRQINACKPWLEAEIGEIKPDGIVCLGATAAQAMMGRDYRITTQRGQFLETELADWIMATYHPSAILRAPDADARAEMRQHLVEDLRAAAAKLKN